ncbi:BCD family chlorophyll transporter-like MFS transporter [Polymorphobacter multimanifer]|uniref:BCD family chlorophyll transporter-like MFS transporter n=1 Tax=Polymorphobacter multimanifer TaxID=1070431 RepID=A0A841L8G3_9SPHN|nr:BCD family MFS transporter [Polymorphobacter multimanifer]MBB6227253.1 BCD family chlorophyll transporter-like MFS transporter [Polymorphobacter multimanifer]
MQPAQSQAPLSWFGIARLGLVQSSIGAVVMLASSLLNRIMVVEYATAAALPAGLVAFHYAVQLSRPKWGHGSDQGWRRTPWIIGGMAVLGLGGVLATQATTMLDGALAPALALAILAYALIGIGVGAAGTSLLALLASRTAEARRPAAASLTWIMMILGIVIAATTVGNLIDPYTPERLRIIAIGLALVAFAITTLAVAGVEGAAMAPEARPAPVSFGEALRGIWGDALTRLFSIFVFVSMLAYSMQDLILEPFAGLVFGMSPGESTRLSGIQHGGVLVGMILVGVGGHAFGGRMGLRLKKWIVGGCLASAVALAGLAMAARVGPEWPLVPTVVLLGFANGVFAVAAIGSMLELAGRGGPGHEGIRMGLWGAAQAMAFGLGGFAGAGLVDLGRSVLGADAPAFELVFAGEALLFLLAAAIAVQLNDRQTSDTLKPTGVLA